MPAAGNKKLDAGDTDSAILASLPNGFMHADNQLPAVKLTKKPDGTTQLIIIHPTSENITADKDIRIASN